MSCLLILWLVIRCTEDALHLCQCTGMYVYKIYIDYLIILINNMQIVTFLFCILYTLLRKWWAGEGGGLIWIGRDLGGGRLLGGGCLLEDRCFIWGNMICACFCVVHIAFIIFADFCLFSKSKKHMQKTLWHHLFPTFVQKQKQTYLFCKNRVGHSLSSIRITMVL